MVQQPIATRSRLPVHITNPVVYSVPSDSEESDTDDHDIVFSNPQHNPHYQRVPELDFLAQPMDILYAYQESLRQKTKPRVSQDDIAGRQQHLDNLRAMKQLTMEESKRHYREQSRKYQQEVANIKSAADLDQNELDKEFESLLKERRARIESAIKLDKDKLQKEAARKEAERKAKEEKDKKEQEAKKKAEDEAKAKEEAAKRAAASTSCSPGGLEDYKKYTAVLDYYKQHYRPRLEDKTFRSTVFKEKMPLKRFIKQLQFKPEVVEQRHVAIRDRLLAVKQQSNDAYHCLLNQMAKDFLLQVRTEVSSISWGAYFYARLAMLLMSSLPEFKDYLMVRLFKRCPYMIPQYHDDPSLSVKEMQKLQRYEYVNEEKTEFQPTDMYYLYQYSYIMFYAALVQMTPQRSDPPNPYGIEHGWIWLARICNIPPRDITAGLLYHFLHVAGQRLLQEYPRQTMKVLRLILDDILPLIPRSRENASPVNELQRVLQDFFQTGIFPKMKEVLDKKV